VPQVTLDCQLSSWIAELLDLPVELGGVSDPFVPPPVQMADVRVDDMRPLQALGDTSSAEGALTSLRMVAWCRPSLRPIAAFDMPCSHSSWAAACCSRSRLTIFSSLGD
jgi:hypothetical protein